MFRQDRLFRLCHPVLFKWARLSPCIAPWVSEWHSCFWFLIDSFCGVFNTEICADNRTACSYSALARETKSKQNYLFLPRRLTKMVWWTTDLVKSVWCTSWRCENVDSSGDNCKAIRTSCSSCFFVEARLRDSLSKSGPLRFASENGFLLNFAHEYILVQK